MKSRISLGFVNYIFKYKWNDSFSKKAKINENIRDMIAGYFPIIPLKYGNFVLRSTKIIFVGFRMVLNKENTYLCGASTG